MINVLKKIKEGNMAVSQGFDLVWVWPEMNGVVLRRLMRHMSKDRLYVFKGRCHLEFFPVCPARPDLQQVFHINDFK